MALVCEAQNVGQLNHQSVLNCVIKPKQGLTDVNIQTVVWKNTVDMGKPLLLYRIASQEQPGAGYRFADPHWKENLNVSLLIASTELADEGAYSVDVMTDSGTANGGTKLQVTGEVY